MAKFEVIRDIVMGVAIRPGGREDLRRVSFKAGQIVEGTKGGLPEIDAGYVDVSTPEGIVRFYLGRMRVIREIGSSGNKIASRGTEEAGFFTPKNIVIGIVVLVGFYVLLKVTT